MNSDSKPPALSISSDSPAVSVPTFACIVYVAAGSDGGVCARVANLAGIEVEAENERVALGKIVPEFKRMVGERLASGKPIAWIDPVPAPEPNEQKRFIPVHL
jgi:hypothetical protein